MMLFCLSREKSNAIEFKGHAVCDIIQSKSIFNGHFDAPMLLQ